MCFLNKKVSLLLIMNFCELALPPIFYMSSLRLYYFYWTFLSWIHLLLGFCLNKLTAYFMVYLEPMIPKCPHTIKEQIYDYVMIESYLEWYCESQELRKLLPCNWHNLVLWCIDKVQSCICRRINMENMLRRWKCFDKTQYQNVHKGNIEQQHKTLSAIFENHFPRLNGA